MKITDLESFVAGITPVFQKAIADASAPLLKRIEVLEARALERGEKGDPGASGADGKDGASITVDDVSPLIADLVAKAIADAPKPQNGADGKDGSDGKDAEPISVVDVVRELAVCPEIVPILALQATDAVAKHIESNPIPAGAEGKPGADGKDAESIDIADVVRELLGCDEIAPILALQAAAEVAKHFDANPVVHGRDGKDGVSVKGDPGESIKGEPGKDGAGIADLLIDRDGALVATMTDGRVKSLGLVAGKDGERGKDGADGFGFDDLVPAYDGERGLTLTFTKGERTKEFKFHLPVVIDRGYWREGTYAKAGDGWTQDGSWWIAQKDTEEKPCRESADWRIGARKGRDGNQGPAGKEYKPPAPVKLDSRTP